MALSDVTSYCGVENATASTNWTAECDAATVAPPRGGHGVSAIDCVTWTLVIADHPGHYSQTFFPTAIWLWNSRPVGLPLPTTSLQFQDPPQQFYLT